MNESAGAQPMPLSGVTVIDCGQLIAGPMIAMLLADFGADVIKVENPAGGDPLRSFGKRRGSVPLYWKYLSRNKRSITLALNRPEGQALFRRVVSAVQPDVIIESFRPGTLERWGIGSDCLSELAPGVILVRVSGFGQAGPYKDRPGFGTLAEAMSGFAHINGHPGGPPSLPPLALADTVSALFGVSATMFALYHRDTRGGSGQMIDLSIFEPFFSILGPQALVYDQLGLVQGRSGNRSPFSA